MHYLSAALDHHADSDEFRVHDAPGADIGMEIAGADTERADAGVRQPAFEGAGRKLHDFQVRAARASLRSSVLRKLRVWTSSEGAWSEPALFTRD